MTAQGKVVVNGVLPAAFLATGDVKAPLGRYRQVTRSDVSEDDIVRRIRGGEVDAGTLVFTSGMTNWTPLGAVPALAAYLGGAVAPASGGPPPVPMLRPSHGCPPHRGGTR